MEAIPFCDKIEVYIYIYIYLFIYLRLYTTIVHNSEKLQLVFSVWLRTR